MSKKHADDLYRKALQLAQSDGDKVVVAGLLREAHKLGSGEASYALADWTRRGVHTEKNERAALRLLKCASERGVAAAAFDLAVSLEKGEGARKNERAAYRNYVLSSLMGDRNAPFEVFRCLWHGVGTRADRQLACAWRSFFKRKGAFVEKED